MAEAESLWRLRRAGPDVGFPSLTFTLQTLLARHEAYMASAERDRLELTVRIDQLERDNAELETRNKTATDDNHGMQEELDQLNDSIKAAETKIGLLEATLLDSQREVRRLENAADRAATLERQIAVLEEEQVVLRTTITRTEEESRSTMSRWRQAEKRLNDLQDQLEYMEKEAKEERERHVEVIGRMERQRAMEKELDTAAGRLKGASAVRSMTDGRNPGNVVSHFVRDLLQDNANLQVGMAELREMLLNSNDEIQMLREQLMYHQPAASHEPSSPTTLHAELAKKEPPTPPQPPRVSQELHVHHHYHVTHKPDARKPRKRRQGLTAGVFTPPMFSAPSSPVTSSARFQRGALAGSLMSPSNEAGMPLSNRWSLQTDDQSEFLASSAPSSPRSTNRDSLFDRVPDLPSPASPTTSLDPASPGWKTTHRKKVSEFSLRSISETAMFPVDTSLSPAGLSRPHPLTHFIMTDPSAPNITNDLPTPASPLAIYQEYDATDSDPPTSPELHHRRNTLRRTISHESIISLANGLDIHTLKARPSQLALRPLGLTAAGTNLSAVTAMPTLVTQGGKRGSVILRDRIASSMPRPEGGRSVSGSGWWGDAERGRDAERGKETGERGASRLGRLVAWRPWGAGAGGGSTDGKDAAPDSGARQEEEEETSPGSTPVLATAAIPALPPPRVVVGDDSVGSPTSLVLSMSPRQGSVASSTVSGGTVVSAMSANAAVMAAVFRAPGINQPGAVPGFWAGAKKRGAPSKVAVGDGEQVGVREALREVLDEM